MGKRQLAERLRRCVFLDRDGVLNEALVCQGRPYPPARIEDLRIYHDAIGGCAALKVAGYLLVVVSNQPDVGRGLTTRKVVEQINERIAVSISSLDWFEICYHAGERYGEDCLCRKPKPGMLFRAAKLWKIDLRGSFLIGDRWRDIDCAKAAGCHAVFINRGYREPLRQLPDATVESFSAAVAAILSWNSKRLFSSSIPAL